MEISVDNIIIYIVLMEISVDNIIRNIVLMEISVDSIIRNIVLMEISVDSIIRNSSNGNICGQRNINQPGNCETFKLGVLLPCGLHSILL
jgi:hypothetical protein